MRRGASGTSSAPPSRPTGLEQLIARTLKLVRLERPVNQLERASIDVAELLHTIAAEVAIEADAQGCSGAMYAEADLDVSGDAEGAAQRLRERDPQRGALQSRRAAVVGITARPRAHAAAPELIEVSVRDHGPACRRRTWADLRALLPRRCGARASQRRGRGSCLRSRHARSACTVAAIGAANVAGGGLVVRISLPADARARAAPASAAAAAA